MGMPFSCAYRAVSRDALSDETVGPSIRGMVVHHAHGEVNALKRALTALLHLSRFFGICALVVAALLAGLDACAPVSGTSAHGGLSTGPTVTPMITLAPLPPTAMPSAAVGSAVCGAWAGASGSTGQPVAARYGAISNCELVGDSWVLATEGLINQPGVIGIDTCHGSASCLDGQTDRDITAWKFYPAPHAGGVRILGVKSPGVLIIDNGGRQLYFTIATGAYNS